MLLVKGVTATGVGLRVVSTARVSSYEWQFGQVVTALVALCVSACGQKGKNARCPRRDT